MKQRPAAIISGGCGGIGRAIGTKLADDGFNIVALYKTTPRETAEAIVKKFPPGNHRAVQCDIQDADVVAEVVQKTAEDYKNIGVCVHAAVDSILRKDILAMNSAELMTQLGTGLLGGFHLLTQTARAMKKNGCLGALVGILSPVSEPGIFHAHMAGYSIEKYALRGLLKELFNELAAASITVNAVSPNFMDTALNADLPAAVRKFMLGHPPHGGINTPKEVARAVSFLASPEGRTINGKIFSFDPKDARPL
jgi:3-oxoacyl-[acyl-carrier protein] reductase